MRALWILVIFLISYGSLYPFNFQWQSLQSVEWLEWLTSFRHHTTRSDILANFLLFAPFGFFGVLSLAKPAGRQSVWGLGWIIVSGVFLALGLQVLQFFLPSRVPTAGDALINLTGILAGCGAAIYVSSRRVRRWFASHYIPEYSPTLVLLILWAAMTFFPYIPSLDWQNIKDGLKAVIQKDITFSGMVWYLATWCICLYSARKVFQQHWSLFRLLLLVGGFLVLEVLVIRNTLSPNSVIVIPLAIVITQWLRAEVVAVVILAALLVSLFARSLFPLEAASPDQSFSLIPFSGFLSGSMWYNILTLLEKLLLYSGLVYFSYRLIGNWLVATVAITGLLLTIEIMQLFVGDHTPELTDPILAIILGYLFAQMDDSKFASERRFGFR